MKKILRFLAVAALTLLPAMASAQGSVTVADGTAGNVYVPVYGYYADAYLRSQSVYPASMLSALPSGQSILSLTFYSSSTSVSWGDVEFEVKLGEVTDTAFSDFSSATLASVYTGPLSIDASGTMQIVFDDAYTYGGGNLLVEVALVEPDLYVDATFLGINCTHAASWQGYSYNSVSDIMGAAEYFLPKMTVAYGAAPTCFRVNDLAVDTATLTTVTLSWTDTVNSGATYSVFDMGTNTLVATSTTTSCTVTGLAASTAYTFGVRADCSATDASLFRTIQAMTACGDVTVLPYTEGFETGLGCWSTVNGSADGLPWGAYSDYSHSGNYAAGSFSWLSTAMHPSAWLISPLFDLTGVADSLTLSWWHRVNSYYYDEPYDVLISTTGADTASFTTTLLSVNPSSSDDWVLNTLDLSAYAGQQFRIAFHHHGSYDQNFLYLDDIVLQAGSYSPVVDSSHSITLAIGVNDATMGTTSPVPGTYTVYAGDVMTVSAVPAPGFFHVAWAIEEEFMGMTMGDTLWYTDEGFESELTLDLTDTTDAMWDIMIALTAIFSADSTPEVPEEVFTMVCGVNNTAYGTTNPAPGTYTYTEGQTVSMVAVPNEGYHVTGWLYKIEYMGMTIIEDTIPYPVNDILTMFNDGDPFVVDESSLGMVMTLIAILEPGDAPIPSDGVTVVTAVNDASMGSITPAPGTHHYEIGDYVYFTMTPAAGHYLHSVHITATHPLYGVIEDETVLASEADFSEPLEIEEGMEGMVISVTAIFAANGEEPPIGISEVEENDFAVSAGEGCIRVSGADGRQVTLFDVNGRQLGHVANAGEGVEFRVSASGVYLVKVGNAAARRVAVVR